MKDLTKAEEQVMHYLWKLKKAFLKDIVEQFPEPRPAYTTISTVIRVLVKKGFISYNTYGKIHEYMASVSKSDYAKKQMKNWVSGFFNNSPGRFTSFFIDQGEMSISELEELKGLIDKQIEKKKDHE